MLRLNPWHVNGRPVAGLHGIEVPQITVPLTDGLPNSYGRHGTQELCALTATGPEKHLPRRLAENLFHSQP